LSGFPALLGQGGRARRGFPAPTCAFAPSLARTLRAFSALPCDARRGIGDPYGCQWELQQKIGDARRIPIHRYSAHRLVLIEWALPLCTSGKVLFGEQCLPNAKCATLPL